MKLSMKDLLERFADCDTFSLTGLLDRCRITEEEFEEALSRKEKQTKDELQKYYEENKEEFVDCPNFEELYEDIKKECIAFDNEENKERFIKRHFDEEKLNVFKMFGRTKEEIKEIKENFFCCSFIASEVGVSTKYSFYNFYNEIAMDLDRRKEKDNYSFSEGESLLQQFPEELAKNLVRYELSYTNPVTISSLLKVNYYFHLNEDTKKYLLNFKSDFDLKELEDLAFYKDGEIKFSSCTHEEFNSLEDEI